MGILLGISITAGILCLIYYIIITAYAGIGTAFAWFWLCAGVGLLIVGFILHIMIKNKIKLPDIVRYLMILAVAAGCIIFLILEGVLVYYSQKEADPGMDYLIVLGAQVRGTVVTKSLKKRLDTAAEYLLDNPDTEVVVSGGRGTGEDITEAEAMRRYLRKQGIEENRIIKEEQSTNTNENISFSRKLLKNPNASVAIVTNGFHVFRSVSIAKKQGLLQVQGLAAPSDRLLILNYYVREVFGVLKDFVFGNL